MDEHAIFEGAWFHLIGIHRQISWESPIGGDRQPFLGSRKSGASAPPQSRLTNPGSHLTRRTLSNEVFESLIAATLSIFIESGNAVRLAILEEHQGVFVHGLLDFSLRLAFSF
jgi:hypothetical protein